MSDPDEKTGHCLCGAIGYAYTGTPRFQVHCHCESCRRATASPFTSFLGVADGQWRWTGEEPKDYISSPGVRRSFCPHCGTQMAYRADKFPGEIHFYAATLTHPEDFTPTAHVHRDVALSWAGITDIQPRT
ncbi:MAG: GFA family protein [Maritimibacter sp.]